MYLVAIEMVKPNVLLYRYCGYDGRPGPYLPHSDLLLLLSITIKNSELTNRKDRLTLENKNNGL